VKTSIFSLFRSIANSVISVSFLLASIFVSSTAIAQSAWEDSECKNESAQCWLKCAESSNQMSCIQRCNDQFEICQGYERDRLKREKEIRRNNNGIFSQPSVTNSPSSPTQSPSQPSSAVTSTTSTRSQSAPETPSYIENNRREIQNARDKVTPSIMAEVALIGSRKAMDCTVHSRDEKGMHVFTNKCDEGVRFHFCYKNYSPRHSKSSKCDYPKSPSYGQASHYGPFDTWQPSIKHRQNLGELPVIPGMSFAPCMLYVEYQGGKYMFVGIEKTKASPDAKYKCYYGLDSELK